MIFAATQDPVFNSMMIQIEYLMELHNRELVIFASNSRVCDFVCEGILNLLRST